MKKYNKKMCIALTGAITATNMQIATLSHALEPNTNQTTLEEKGSKSSAYVEVTNSVELQAALKNPSVKTIDIKDDIVFEKNEKIY